MEPFGAFRLIAVKTAQKLEGVAEKRWQQFLHFFIH